MNLKFLSEISSFVGKCKCVNSVWFVGTFCKYFICLLFIFFPYFVEASSFTAGNVATEYSEGFFMSSENLFEFPDSVTIENIDIMPRVKTFPELGSRIPEEVAFVQSVVEMVSDPRHTKNSTSSKQPQISCSQNNSEDLHVLIPLLLPMFVYTLIWCFYSIGYYRGKIDPPDYVDEYGKHYRIDKKGTWYKGKRIII